MLYSILVGFIAYYVVLFAIGLLVNAMAIEGELITLAVICFVGAYLVRYSRFVHRLALVLGTIATIILVTIWVILPMLAGSNNTWLIILAVIVGLVMYATTRPRVFRYFTRHRIAPPFGREWCRWLFIVLI